MAHKVGRAIGQSKWEDIGTGKNWDRFTTGMRGTFEDFGNLAGDAWDALSGQVDPNMLEYIDWQQQQYDPSWNLQAETGTAQGYTGQGYNATQLGSAQGYTGQGYDAMTGDYQTGQQFQDILGQAMGAAGQFMDPSSDWARGQQAIVAEQSGQLAGQFVEKKEVLHSTLEGMSREQLEKRLKELEKKIDDGSTIIDVTPEKKKIKKVN